MMLDDYGRTALKRACEALSEQTEDAVLDALISIIAVLEIPRGRRVLARLSETMGGDRRTVLPFGVHPTVTKDAHELEPGDAVINIGMVRSVEANGTEIIVTLESDERLPVTAERDRFVVFKRNKAFERHVAEDMTHFATLPPGVTGPGETQVKR